MLTPGRLQHCLTGKAVRIAMAMNQYKLCNEANSLTPHAMALSMFTIPAARSMKMVALLDATMVMTIMIPTQDLQKQLPSIGPAETLKQSK